MLRGRVRGSLFCLAALASAFSPAAAPAFDKIDTEALQKAIKPERIMEHMRALEAVAVANGGTRTTGSPGFDRSLEYIQDTLKKAGYKTRVQPFNTTGSNQLLVFNGSDGSANAAFPTFSAGYQALVELPEATAVGVQTMLKRVQGSGASAVVFYPADQTIFPALEKLVPALKANIPTKIVSHAAALKLKLRIATSSVVDGKFDPEPKLTPLKSANLFADTETGDPNETLVIGAHVDSVPTGPGLNDNASGVAATLELAVQFAKLGIKPRRKVRFAFWGGEEQVRRSEEDWEAERGSRFYLDQLSKAERKRIFASLNLDMIGSPNFARFVWGYSRAYIDQARSVFDRIAPATRSESIHGEELRTQQISDLFDLYFAERKLPFDRYAFDGRSDYDGFLKASVPAGGVLAGIGAKKSQHQAMIFDGNAGQPFDACYHRMCDTTTNVNMQIAIELARAQAHAALTLGSSPSGFAIA